MSQRKLKNALLEQKNIVLSDISKIVSGQIQVDEVYKWSAKDGKVLQTAEHCQFVAIEKAIKDYESKVLEIKNKYR